MKRTAMTEKLLVLGVDGMDPTFTKYLMEEGLLPNIKAYVEKGAARKDLKLLGSNPTITPPLWTTLATGAEPRTHGITCFWNQHPDKLDTAIYNLDSRMCLAEQIWNIFAEEANKKTLVWHWPGSSWPPTSDSSNLHVVDGAQPAFVNMGSGMIDSDKRLYAAEKITEVAYVPCAATADSGVGCVIKDLPDLDSTAKDALDKVMGGGKQVVNIMLSHDDGELAFAAAPYDVINSPVRPAKGWAQAPENAKEFTIVLCNGLVRRMGLILANEAGIYDHVAVYQTKKDTQPIAVLTVGEPVFYVYDDVLVNDQMIPGSRTYELIRLAEDGSELSLWVGLAYKLNNDDVWHPKSLYSQVVENIGNIPTAGICGSHEQWYVQMMEKFWDHYLDWQAGAILYLMKANNYEMIFSHIHNVDSDGHSFWHFAKDRHGLHGEDNVAFIRNHMIKVYQQTDDYLGRFLHLLDEGWTILIISDHGIICPEQDETPLIGDAFGLNVGVMKELGYTVLKKDTKGNELREIDWEKTRAVQIRGTHIYLNLKGRNSTGIVDPRDQYELESQIISDLYNYRLNGKRVIAMAMRNKDALSLGMGGERCGDILCWVEEGHNRPHGDALSTYDGYWHTSVSPIFIAAGSGVKSGYTIERVVKQVDVAPTIAALGGVRMPAQCEGAPMYQIFSEEF